jgi:hypothetical protein
MIKINKRKNNKNNPIFNLNLNNKKIGRITKLLKRKHNKSHNKFHNLNNYHLFIAHLIYNNVHRFNIMLETKDNKLRDL